jgi:hypothetical protein
MRQNLWVHLLIWVEDMRFMMTHLKVLRLLMLGLAQQLKVLVVLQKITLDGKHFMVVIFK